MLVLVLEELAGTVDVVVVDVVEVVEAALGELEHPARTRASPAMAAATRPESTLRLCFTHPA